MLDGWRVDVANMTGRRCADDYLREVAALLRRTATAARPDALLVAEHFHDASGDLDRDGWQGTMNYAGFTRPLWSWLRTVEPGPLDEVSGLPGGLPRRAGPVVVAGMRQFAASVSWRAFTHSWTLAGSHDTPRIRTVVGSPELHEVAAGLLLTMPGTPMIFAGDELGLVGVNGEDSRTPMPWHRPASWDVATLRRYRQLIALRHRVPALRHGGFRWAHVDDDAVAFLRETHDAAVLVFARRAAGEPIALPGFGAAENLYGGADAPVIDGGLRLPADGPTFQVWNLA
jgi:alpha-glucosidase